MHYLLFYKPYNVLSSFNGDAGQQTLAGFVPILNLEPAGRLDQDSEGLLLLTDDGDLLHRLTHPHFEHPKTYYVQVEGSVPDEALTQLRQGVAVKGERTQPADVERIAAPDLPPRTKPVRADLPTTWLKIVLREGKKRQIRHMTAAVGFPTLRLVRVAIGALTIERLQPGEWRRLGEREVKELKEVRRISEIKGNESAKAKSK